MAKPGRAARPKCGTSWTAEPGAAIALGFRQPITRQRLLESTRTGEIEQLVNWFPVKAGETYFTPAHTVHAIGGGHRAVRDPAEFGCDLSPVGLRPAARAPRGEGRADRGSGRAPGRRARDAHFRRPRRIGALPTFRNRAGAADAGRAAHARAGTVPDLDLRGRPRQQSKESLSSRARRGCSPKRASSPRFVRKPTRASCGPTCRGEAGAPVALAYPQLVDPLQRRAARAANQRVAIAAYQRFGDRLGAGGAVELGGGLLGFGHMAIIDPTFTTLRRAGR